MTAALKKLLSNKIIRRIIVIGLAVLAAVSVIQGIRNAIEFSQDFQWDAAKALVLKIDPYELSLNTEKQTEYAELEQFYRLFTDAGLKQKMEANQFPSLLMLLLPYTFLSPLAARYAWLVSNLLFTAGIVVLLRKTFLKKMSSFGFTAVMLLMLAGTPYRNQLGVGQHTLFSFFFFLLAVWLDEKSERKNSVWICLCMTVSYFKYTLTAPLTLYLLYKRRIKEFIGSILIHIVMTAVSAVWLNKSIVYMLIAPLKVSSALSAEGGLDIMALLSGNAIAYVIGALVAVMLVVISIMMPAGNDELLFSVLAMWSLIITYHRTYDFFVISAVISLFYCTAARMRLSDKMNTFLEAYYGVLLLAVFFGLRLFNENTASKAAVGLLYYIFTVIITAVSVKQCIKGGKRLNEE